MFRIVVFLFAMMLTVSIYGLNDPTRPLTFRDSSVAAGQLKLESILISKERKVAVISGVVVAEGDSVGAVKVISISKNVVRVLSDGRIVDMVLSNVPIRQEK